MKTRLELILDWVKAGEREVTLDVRELTREQIDHVIAVVKSRGLDAASDGKWILVRDLSNVGLG